MRALVLASVCLLSAMSVGCAAQYPTLKFTSKEGKGTLEQPFSTAAMTRDKQGDWDVVLVSQGLENPRSFWRRAGTAMNPVRLFRKEKTAGKDLSPVAETPVRQVVHIKMHWRPSRGAMPDNPAAANATVRWVLFGSSEPGSVQDMLEYQGTAFVRPVFGDDGYMLKIREGTLRRSALSGDMLDPLGSAKVEGDIALPDDPATVAGVLRDLPPATPVEAPARNPLPSTMPAARPSRSR